MADEQTKPPFNKKSIIPQGHNWPSLQKKEGDELRVHYRHILESLGKEKGILGIIFRKSENRIQDPAKLRHLVNLIDLETWIGIDIDIKGEIYEGLLQKNAEEIKSGAGQYFTPRALIKAIVEVMRPEPGQVICDPACGTGGFFLGCYNYIINNYQLDNEQKRFLRFNTFKGNDIVNSVVRLCTMNMYLHGIGDANSPIQLSDSLLIDPAERFDLVLTNPPFGKKSIITVFNGDGGRPNKESIIYERRDFWVTTSNKQLNFLQHIKTILKNNGRAAIVIPDNVLFEGGAGETVRRRLLDDFDVHTLLRLPTGIFYTQGIKANVLFFDKKLTNDRPSTKNLWIYDFRTNKHFTLKTGMLRYEDLKDFIECYNPENRHERKETERFKSFTYDEILKRDKTNLDIFWLIDKSLEESDNLLPPNIIAHEIVENLQSALIEFSQIEKELI